MSDKCKHDPNLNGTTLVKNSKYKMINPQVYEFFCPCCKKVFKFGVNAFGKYYEIVSELESNRS